MPYDLKELAAISGMPGLYKLLKAARHGVLVESLDDKKTRSMAPARNKVSMLGDISIYTADYDTTVPLADAFERIRQHYGAQLPITGKSSEAELKEFMTNVIPDYDRERVYLSDIKKLASWYSIVSQHLPYQEAVPEAPAEAVATEKVTPEAKKKAKADEPLSTGGAIEPLETPATADAEANPEAATPAKKKASKKAE